MQLIPFGYLYKRVALRETWPNAARVVDIYSLSNCMSKEFCDYISDWRHNGYYLFDTPEIMRDLALRKAVSLSDCTLFYYEGTPEAYDEDLHAWVPLEAKFGPISVLPPLRHVRCGFDVVSFCYGAFACSPLSCNGLAAEIATNQHCLFDTLAEAVAALERGAFDRSEPGPFRIIAVHRVEAEK